MNITAPFRRLARVMADVPAIIRADDTSVSYAALDRAIDRVAARVAGLGLHPGDTAGLPITGPDESLGLILALALARLGIASADPTLPAARRRLSFAPGGGPGVVGFDASWLAEGGAAADVPIPADGAAVCRVFASSGTTGAAKHLAISHDLMTRRVFANWLTPGAGRLARIVAVNLGITWGFTATLRTLWQGGTLVLTNPRDAVAAIPRHHVASLLISPVGLRALLDALPPGGGRFPTLATIEVGGSLIPAPLREAAAARLGAGIVIYLGASETGGIASGPADALSARPGAVGYVHPDVEVQAVDAQDRPVPPGVEGALRVRSALTVAGYVGTEDRATAAFRDGWFYPGDLGAVWPDGALTLAGRVGEVINSGGIKVNPAAIEDALLSLPGVSEAAVFGVPDALGVDQVWAAIVAAAPIATAALSRLCQERLAGQAPRFILQMKALPRNANGKVRKDLLIAYAQQQARAGG
ncbi:MAG: class I adenylate-forming enzyme family protein [Acetobacteraceae bacterium]